MRKIRIESKGSPLLTNIYDADTGKELNAVKRLTLTLDADKPRLTLVCMKSAEDGRFIVEGEEPEEEAQLADGSYFLAIACADSGDMGKSIAEALHKATGVEPPDFLAGVISDAICSYLRGNGLEE